MKRNPTNLIVSNTSEKFAVYYVRGIRTVYSHDICLLGVVRINISFSVIFKTSRTRPLGYMKTKPKAADFEYKLKMFF